MITIVVLIALNSFVELSYSSRQIVNVEGTLGLESFDPMCLKATPPCAQPSFAIPILVGDGSVFLLRSDESSIRQQLFSKSGSHVRISGFAQPFNATQTYTGYLCSPYDCDRLQSEIIVTAIYSPAASDNSASNFSAFLLALVVVSLVSLVVWRLRNRSRSLSSGK
jgi:hypothetical protein